jgi:hypothetical protein
MTQKSRGLLALSPETKADMEGLVTKIQAINNLDEALLIVRNIAFRF